MVKLMTDTLLSSAELRNERCQLRDFFKDLSSRAEKQGNQGVFDLSEKMSEEMGVDLTDC